MPTVLLATCAALPEGEPEGDLLLRGFAAAGVEAGWAVWDDAAVDWAAADLVATRATWDYERRLPEFLAWARGLGARLLHGADVFAWNTDKHYLLSLVEAGLPVVPTRVATDEAGLRSAIASWPRSVVKPTVGAGGRGLVLVDETHPLPGEGHGAGPWVVQPVVESVLTEGEHSVFVLGGDPVAQARKAPGAGGEIRVHERYGGSTVPVDLDPTAADLARRTVRAAEHLLGTDLVYARVDLLRLADGSLALGELEVTEPGLYLPALPGNAERFVAAVLPLLG